MWYRRRCYLTFTDYKVTWLQAATRYDIKLSNIRTSPISLGCFLAKSDVILLVVVVGN